MHSYQNVPSRGGIPFAAQRPGQMRNLRFEHLSVRNCTHNGVATRGAAQVAIVASEFPPPIPAIAALASFAAWVSINNLLLTRVIRCRNKRQQPARLSGAVGSP